MSFNPYAFRNYVLRMQCTRPAPCLPRISTTIDGVRTLRDQIASYRAGGLKSGVRQLSDSNYDEDDQAAVDPSSQFGLDRFERATAITDQISDRMSRKKREKLDHAEV